MKTRKSEVATLISVYNQEYEDIGTVGVSEKNVGLLAHLKQSLLGYVIRIDKFFDDAKALEHLEEAKVIEQKLADEVSKEKADSAKAVADLNRQFNRIQ